MFRPAASANMPGVDRAGWILTGGASSRMGFDKALAELDGRPMTSIIGEALAKVCGPVTIVGDPAKYGHLNHPVIPDNFPGLGPLSGIEAALSATGADHNLIVACDMPALDSATLESLFAAGCDCVIPQYPDGRLEPLCAMYHRRAHAAILRALRNSIRRVTEALTTADPPLAIRYLPVDRRASFANLNTPADLSAYRSRQHD